MVRKRNGDPRPAWFNDEVDTSAEDRVVSVWTRIHNRETELQRMLGEIESYKGPKKRGIAVYRSVPLSEIERHDD